MFHVVLCDVLAYVMFVYDIFLLPNRQKTLHCLSISVFRMQMSVPPFGAIIVTVSAFRFVPFKTFMLPKKTEQKIRLHEEERMEERRKEGGRNQRGWEES